MVAFDPLGLQSENRYLNRLVEELRLEIDRLLKEVREWWCPKCELVVPPPSGARLLHGECGSLMMPRTLKEVNDLKKEIDNWKRQIDERDEEIRRLADLVGCKQVEIDDLTNRLRQQEKRDGGSGVGRFL